MDLVGQQFGEWTVIGKDPESYRGHSRWMCRCSCGTERVVLGNNLKRGLSRSCGHGARTVGGLWATNTSEYDTWRQMLARCGDPRNPNYHNYGGRGIWVCERWHDTNEEGFANFLLDMGPRHFKGAHLDRIDNNGPYMPSNCHWVTAKENANNSSTVRRLEYDGRSLTISEWAERLGVKRSIISARISNGWSVERALTQPPRRSPQSKSTSFSSEPTGDNRRDDQPLVIDPPRRTRRTSSL